MRASPAEGVLYTPQGHHFASAGLSVQKVSPRLNCWILHRSKQSEAAAHAAMLHSPCVHAAVRLAQSPGVLVLWVLSWCKAAVKVRNEIGLQGQMQVRARHLGDITKGGGCASRSHRQHNNLSHTLQGWVGG